MHEMSLIERVVEMVGDSANREGITKVTKVKLVIGKMKNALPEAMQFAFETFTGQAPFAPEAALEIEERETKLKCKDCDCEFKPDIRHYFRCPQCDSGNSSFISGREFYVEYYEGE